MFPIQLLSIVLPVYNEGVNITKQIEQIEKSVLYKHEILVIFDFDEDSTVPFVKRLQKKHKTIKLIKNISGRGVINAIKTGIKVSRGEIVVIMAADLADDVRTINKMYEKMRSGLDIVCATRYAKGGGKIGGPVVKTFLSQAAGLMTPLFLGIQTTDIANGFKMYKKKVLNSIDISSSGGWEYSCELIIKAHHAGYKIGEVPTVWKDRTAGKSNFKLLRWLPKYIRWYLWGFLLRLKIDRLFF